MFEAYLGTTAGMYRLDHAGLEPLGLESERLWATHAWRENSNVVVLAGSYGNGIYRSEERGATWQSANSGLTATALRFLGPDPSTPGAILAGTEPGRIYRSTDGGQSWLELVGITEIAGYDTWYLPYSPRAGAVRNVYSPPGANGLLFASVEVGGLLRSDDRGSTWSCDTVLKDDDIHFITGQPTEPEVLYASLGYAALRYREDTSAGYHFGGIARSDDRGESWRKLEGDYTRATFVPRARPDLLLAGPSPDVGRNGRIVVSDNRGESWKAASDGLVIPMPDMVELFVDAPDDTVWAITSGGRLLQADPGEWQWRSLLPVDTQLRVESVSFVEAM